MKLKRSQYNSFEEIKADCGGGRCLVMGNGPSINNLDWNIVRNVFTIGVNRIGLIFTPDVHVKVDKFKCETKSPAKVSWEGYSGDDGYICRGQKHPSVPLALYIAFDLGFREIYLAGVDFQGNYFWGENPAKKQHNDLYYKQNRKNQMLHISDFSYIIREVGGNIYNCSRYNCMDFLEYSDLFNKKETNGLERDISEDSHRIGREQPAV